MEFREIFQGGVTDAKWRALGEHLQGGSIRGGPGLQVRKVGNKTVISTRRKGFSVSDGTSEPLAYTPWAPVFFTEGTGESLVYKCRFNLGTVNNVPAGNWNNAFTLPSNDDLKFAVITMTTESGKVTGVTIALETSAPTEDSISKDAPPVEFKMVLGAVGKNSGKMIISKNLQMTAAEIYKETKTAPAVGGEPFSRWYRWSQTL